MKKKKKTDVICFSVVNNMNQMKDEIVVGPMLGSVVCVIFKCVRVFL